MSGLSAIKCALSLRLSCSHVIVNMVTIHQIGQQLSCLIQTNYALCFSVMFLFFLVYRKLTFGGNSNLNLPPSPPKLPIIGNLHQLGKLPHRSLRALSKKYGPLMLLHLGQTPTLVVSSAETAKEMIKAHDIVFANRPKTIAADIFLYGCVDLAFSSYSEYWRQVRKLAVVEFFSLKKVQSFQFIREEEVEVLVDKIRKASGSCLNLSEMLLVISYNIVSRCVLGRKAEEDGKTTELGKVMRRMTVQFSEFSFLDSVPFLGWMDHLSGLISRLRSTSAEMNSFLDQVTSEKQEKLATGDGQFDQKNLADILLQLRKDGMRKFELTHDNVKAILTDMLVGGTETTSALTGWTMAELIKHKNVMKKAQEEVRRIVGKKLKVEQSDVEKMSYLKCIIKESLRLHPPAPLLLPKETSATVELGGYHIPPKTTVHVNVLAIQTDPEVWNKPEEFLPERFEDSSIDFKGQDFEFVPFGGGRRICPGISFGMASVEFIIANVLYWFEWKLADGEAPEDLDMSEDYGLSVCKKYPLRVVPTLKFPLSTDVVN